jgi:hypothetical protein
MQLKNIRVQFFIKHEKYSDHQNNCRRGSRDIHLLMKIMYDSKTQKIKMENERNKLKGN